MEHIEHARDTAVFHSVNAAIFRASLFKNLLKLTSKFGCANFLYKFVERMSGVQRVMLLEGENVKGQGQSAAKK